MSLNKSLLRRIVCLEQRLGPMELPKIVVVFGLDKQDYENMGPADRIVFDRISDVDGLLTALHRITSDPNDRGRTCEAVTTSFSHNIRWVDPDRSSMNESKL